MAKSARKAKVAKSTGTKKRHWSSTSTKKTPSSSTSSSFATSRKRGTTSTAASASATSKDTKNPKGMQGFLFSKKDKLQEKVDQKDCVDILQWARKISFWTSAL